MKEIIFDSLKLHNVRCHEDMEVNFPLNKVVAITGKNGKGKTTIPKSIQMALYGVDDEGIEISDMVSKKIGKNLEIIFNFRIKDQTTEDKYTIELYHNHSKKSNKLLFFKNGIDISGKTKTETYKIIETYIIPRKVYNNTVHFTQQVKDFFTALTNSDQKKIFDSILSLEIWDDRYIKTTSSISKLESSIKSTQDNILSLNSTISEKENSLVTLENDKIVKISNNEKLIQLTKENIKSISDKIESNKQSKNQIIFKDEDILSEKEKMYKMKIELKSLSDKLQSFSNAELEKIKNCEKEIDTNYKIILNDNVNSRNIFYVQQVDEIKKESNKVLENKSKISDKFSTSALENQKNIFLVDINKEIKYVLNQISEVTTQFSTAELEQEKNEKISKLAEKQKDALLDLQKLKTSGDQKVKEKNEESVKLEQDRNLLNQQEKRCSKCKQILQTDDSINEILIEIKSLETKIENLTQEINSIKINFNNLKKDIVDLDNEKNTIIKDYNELIQIKVDKRNEKNTELLRKKLLLEQESENGILDINKKIEILNLQKNEELLITNKQLNDLNFKINEIQLEQNAQIKKINEDIKKEQDEKKKEQINVILELFKKEKENLWLDQKIIAVNIEVSENNLRNLEDLKQQSIIIDKVIETSEIQLINEKDKLSQLENYKYDDSQINKVHHDIFKSKTELSNLQKSIDDIIDRIDILKFWKQGFSNTGIKSMLMDIAIPFMNNIVSKELERLTHGKFIVSFDTLSETKLGDIKDKFKIRILNCENGADKHCLLSGGEKRLVDLCCMEALKALAENMYQKKFLVTIYDEALDSLDDDNSAIFCKLMKQMSVNKNIVIITHKTLQQMEADEVLKL
jgi:DNA repair exonuclease SbcCD ATPase subunit